MVGNNLKAHLEALEKQMRDAAADLDFERAARLRDEIKRLRETELAISDDPLARYAESESPVSGREKGKHNKGRAHAPRGRRRMISALEGEMRRSAARGSAPPRRRQAADGAAGTPASGRGRRPSSPNPRSTTWAPAPTPYSCQCVPRSLFKKQSARRSA